MNFLLKLTKYVAVPIMIEWLNAIDIIRIDTAFTNHNDRNLILSLMKEYSNLFHRMMFSTCHEISILQFCGWSLKFGTPSDVSCGVYICKYDQKKLKEFGWIEYCLQSLARIKTITIPDIVNTDDITLWTQLQHVTSLTLSNSSFEVMNYFNSGSQLTSLTLVSIMFKDYNKRSFIDLCRNNPQLTYLHLDFTSYGMEDFVVFAIMLHCKNLQQLKCGDSFYFERRTLFMFVFHCVSRQLTVLDGFTNHEPLQWLQSLLWCKGKRLQLLHTDFLARFDQNVIPPMVDVINENCPSLLLNIDSQIYSKPVVDVLLHSMGSRIFKFNLYRESSSSIVYMCTRCAFLKELVLNDCSVSNDHFIVILKSCSLLNCLGLTNVKGLVNGYLKEIVLFCPNIIELILRMDMTITIENIAWLKSLKALSTLTITVCSSAMCLQLLVSFNSLANLTVYGHKKRYVMESVSLDRYDGFTNSLKTLQLHNLPISNEYFHSMLVMCPNLTDLVLVENHLMDRNAMLSVYSNCRKLRRLCIDNCSKIGRMENTLLSEQLPRFVTPVW